MIGTTSRLLVKDVNSFCGYTARSKGLQGSRLDVILGDGHHFRQILDDELTVGKAGRDSVGQ
jgi:hypothetical protein